MTQKRRSHSCCDGSSPVARRLISILGLCSRPEAHSALYCRLVVETDEFEEWRILPAKAEKHGLAPLVFFHLKAINALTPEDTLLALRGLAFRHRRAAAAFNTTLSDVLSGLPAQGIPVLALKGAALANLVYPEPGLRPMRDLDLLVKPEDAGRAQAYLVQLGFCPYLSGSLKPDANHHHLPILQQVIDGQPVSIEVHTGIFPNTRHYRQLGFDNLNRRAVSFRLGPVEGHTLGYEDMLWHIYRHALGPPLLASPLRFVHLADIAGWVEKFARQIDWDRMNSLYPQAVNSLKWMHFLTPWSDNTLSCFPFAIPESPQDVGRDYRGWPRREFSARTAASKRRLLKQTLSPPDWWLRIFYGANGDVSLFWNRWLRHPIHLLEWVGHFALERVHPERPVFALSDTLGPDPVE